MVVLLEVADVFAVNKADLPGAANLVRHLRGLWSLGARHEEGDWRSPVVQTVASEGKGVEELAGRLGEHREWLTRHARGAEQERRRIERQVLERGTHELRIACDHVHIVERKHFFPAHRRFPSRGRNRPPQRN